VEYETTLLQCRLNQKTWRRVRDGKKDHQRKAGQHQRSAKLNDPSREHLDSFNRDLQEWTAPERARSRSSESWLSYGHTRKNVPRGGGKRPAVLSSSKNKKGRGTYGYQNTGAAPREGRTKTQDFTGGGCSKNSARSLSEAPREVEPKIEGRKTVGNRQGRRRRGEFPVARAGAKVSRSEGERTMLYSQRGKTQFTKKLRWR